MLEIFGPILMAVLWAITANCVFGGVSVEMIPLGILSVFITYQVIERIFVYVHLEKYRDSPYVECDVVLLSIYGIAAVLANLAIAGPLMSIAETSHLYTWADLFRLF